MKFAFNLRVALPLATLLAGTAARAVTASDLAARLSANERILLIDLRTASQYGDGHIPGAINIPLGLLPYKPLPSSELVVLYGDGLGVVDETKALAIARSKPGLTVDFLQGGYAGWLAETRLTTASPGVTRETIPGITYQQLVAANKADVVLVDLRDRTAASAAAVSKQSRPATAAMTTDILEDFAKKIGVPVILPNGAAAGSARAAAPGGAPARAASAASGNGNKSDRLLVLVADNNAAADAAARQLRASGNYRFTVLIGGTEIIRHEGRTGTGRMGGELPVVPNR